MSEPTRSLALLDQVGQLLASAKSFDEIKSVRDKAEAVRKYVQSAAMGLSLQNSAAELKLRAERKAGEFLSQLAMRGGNRKSNSHGGSLKLADLGLNYNQSARWQLEAAIPENVFQQYIADANQTAHEITARGLLRMAKRLDGRSEVAEVSRNRNSTRRCGGMPRNRLKPATRTCDQDSAVDLLNELENHHRLLQGILQPICAERRAQLQPIDKRTILHLSNEIQQLLQRIKSLL